MPLCQRRSISPSHCPLLSVCAWACSLHLCLWSCPRPRLQRTHLSVSIHACSVGTPWVTHCDLPQVFYWPVAPLPSRPAGSRHPWSGLASQPCRHAPVPEAGGTGVSSGPFLCSLLFCISTWRFSCLPASVREGGSCSCSSRAPCTEWPETTQI